MSKENSAKIYFSVGLGLLALISPILIFVSHILHYIWTLTQRLHPKRIAGEVVVVTGAGNGIGRSIALELAKNGCHVAVVDINLPDAEETVELIKSNFNVKSQAYKVDVTSLSQVEQLNDDVKRDLGLATILVNNAGILLFKNQTNPEPSEIERLIDVNYTSHFWTIRVFLENMKSKRKGHIVGLSSILGLFPSIYCSHYSSSKFAVRGLMHSLRMDLKVSDFNEIHATTVYPYFVKTNPKLQELTKHIEVSNIYSELTANEVAESVVEGILYRKKEVFVPSFFGILFRLLDCMPASFQDFILYSVMGSFEAKMSQLYGSSDKCK